MRRGGGAVERGGGGMGGMGFCGGGGGLSGGCQKVLLRGYERMRGRGDVWRVGWWLVVEGGEVGEDDLVDIGAALDMSEADVDWELHR